MTLQSSFRLNHFVTYSENNHDIIHRDGLNVSDSIYQKLRLHIQVYKIVSAMDTDNKVGKDFDLVWFVYSRSSWQWKI